MLSITHRLDLDDDDARTHGQRHRQIHAVKLTEIYRRRALGRRSKGHDGGTTRHDGAHEGSVARNKRAAVDLKVKGRGIPMNRIANRTRPASSYVESDQIGIYRECVSVGRLNRLVESWRFRLTRSAQHSMQKTGDGWLNDYSYIESNH